MSDYLKKRQQFILDGRPLPKKEVKYIAKKSAKRIAKEKEQGLQKGDTPLDNWFEERRLEMTGRCALCGGKTERDNDETYRRSIHHLFDKRDTMFPSVALHEDNFLELCFFGNSCHTNIHNKIITWELLMDSAEREMILAKCRNIIPQISEGERKHIPDILIQLLK